MTIKKLTKDTLIYEEGQENSLDIINNNFEELDNSNAKLNSENIFTKDQTIKHDWVSFNLDSPSHSSLRYKENWIEIFALSVWSEKDFKISRFVNWNWVWNAFTIKNDNWWIILWNIPTSPAGLSSGCIWRDGENLKIIP